MTTNIKYYVPISNDTYTVRIIFPGEKYNEKVSPVERLFFLNNGINLVYQVKNYFKNISNVRPIVLLCRDSFTGEQIRNILRNTHNNVTLMSNKFRTEYLETLN